MKAPRYKGPPLSTVEALAWTLQVGVDELRAVSSIAGSSYRGPLPKPKKGGVGVRFVFDPLPRLKRIQRRIVDRVFSNVDYPDYLYGGIRDPLKRRGYIRHARHHAGAKVLVGEDVSDFFPSVPASRVRRVFLHVFHFHPEVADVLTSLCTHTGCLPQGAPTSTDLANLAFYDLEPTVEEDLSKQGIRYTRFIDDIYASSNSRIAKRSRSLLVAKLRGMIERGGFGPKRKKQFFASQSRRMEVHGLSVNGEPSRSTADRRKLRQEIFLLRKRLEHGAADIDFDRAYRSIATRIGVLKATNVSAAGRLRRELLEVRRAARVARGVSTSVSV